MTRSFLSVDHLTYYKFLLVLMTRSALSVDHLTYYNSFLVLMARSVLSVDHLTYFTGYILISLQKHETMHLPHLLLAGSQNVLIKKENNAQLDSYMVILNVPFLKKKKSKKSNWVGFTFFFFLENGVIFP